MSVTLQDINEEISGLLSSSLNDELLPWNELVDAVNRVINKWNIDPLTKGTYNIRDVVSCLFEKTENIDVGVNADDISFTTDIEEELGVSGLQTLYYFYITGLSSGNGTYLADKIYGNTVSLTPINVIGSLVSEESAEATYTFFKRYDTDCFYDPETKKISVPHDIKRIDKIFIGDYRQDNQPLEKRFDVSSYPDIYYKIDETTYQFTSALSVDSSIKIFGLFFIPKISTTISSATGTTTISAPDYVVDTIITGVRSIFVGRYGDENEAKNLSSEFEEQRYNARNLSRTKEEGPQSNKLKWTPLGY